MEKILSAFRVLSDRSFSCSGEVVETPGGSLLKSLQEALYRSCYTRPFDGTSVPERALGPADEGLVRELRAANCSRTLHVPGWKVEQTGDAGKILASRSGVARWFLPGHYLLDASPGSSAKKDGAVSIYMPRDNVTEQGGYYRASGETVGHEHEYVHLLRFYWNISMAGAPLLMRELTRELNRFQVPYLFKCGDQAMMYDRVDSAVLYVNRRYRAILSRIVIGVYPRVAQVLRPLTPLFTRRLAPGLAFAEDPGNGEGFGMNRCRIVAETLQACYENHWETIEDRTTELEKQFRQRGVDPQRPYLNPGATDDYEFGRIPA